MNKKFRRRSVPKAENGCCQEKKSEAVEYCELGPLFYCGRDVIPTDALGVVTITRLDGTTQRLRHGDVVPDDINGIVVMDPTNNEIKFFEGPIQQERLKEIVNQCIDMRSFVTQQELTDAVITMARVEIAIQQALLSHDSISQSELDSAIAAIDIPAQMTGEMVKNIFNACLADAGYITAVDACALIDQKVPAAVAAIDVSVDPAEVIGYVQGHLNTIDFVNLSQVKTCIEDAIKCLTPEVDLDKIKCLIEDCIEEAIDDMPAQNRVTEGEMTCTPSGFVVTTLKQSNFDNVVITSDFSKFLSEAAPDPVSDAQIAAVAKPVAQTCVDNAIDALPDPLTESDVQAISKPIAQQCVNDALPGIQTAGSITAQTLIDQAINNLPPAQSYCLTDLDITINNGVLNATIQQEGNCADVTASATLPAGSITNTVTGGSMTCTPAGVLSVSINQSGAGPAVITGDLSKFFDDTDTTLTEQNVIDIVTPLLGSDDTYCITSHSLTIESNQLTSMIQQENCDPILASVTLPEGAVSSTVSGIAQTCDANGNLTTTITQTGGDPVSTVTDLSKFLDNTNLTNQDVINIVTPLLGNNETNCITSHTFSIDNNVLMLTTAQDGCDPVMGTIPLPEGAVSSTVSTIEMLCDENGQVTTTITQTGGEPVVGTSDFSKFLDNVTLTTEEVETIAKPIAQQCVDDALANLPSSGAQNVQDGSSLVCDENNNLTLTVAQSAGPALVLTEDLSGKAGTSINVESASYDVVNPDTVNSQLVITHTLSNGETVDVTIPGSDIISLISAFFTCETVTDPNATCEQYTSLQIDGEELCQLQGYETPENYCETKCLHWLDPNNPTVGYAGEGTISLVTSNGPWSVTWPDGSVGTYISGETAAYNFTGELVDANGDPLQITICHDDPCATTSDFIITPAQLADTLTSKGCGC